MNREPSQITSVSHWTVPMGREVQDAPSAEVRTVPQSPTAAKVEPDQATALRLLVGGATCGVQVEPSGEVSTMPWFPTTTNSLPDQTTPLSVEKEPLFSVQVAPSVDP